MRLVARINTGLERPSPNLKACGPNLLGGWDKVISFYTNNLNGCSPNLGVPNGGPTLFIKKGMFPTFFVFLHKCIEKGWDHSLRLGTPLKSNSFSCPQPRSVVGDWVGTRERLGQTAPSCHWPEMPVDIVFSPWERSGRRLSMSTRPRSWVADALQAVSRQAIFLGHGVSFRHKDK